MDNAGDIVWEYMKEILLQVLGMAPVQLEFPVPDCELGLGLTEPLAVCAKYATWQACISSRSVEAFNFFFSAK